MTAQHTILLVEKRSSKSTTFASALERKGYELEVVQTGSEALKRAPGVEPVLVILNAASLGSSGVRICHSLKEEVGKPIIHIIDEDVELSRSDSQNADIVLDLPFTARKLVNRIKRLMPADSDDTLEAWHITFVESTRVVRIPDRETRLTPKAADLLQIFLANPGKTLDRGYLMRQVWKTDYVGDTRTLDVHVRWVRQAIEPDPASPRYILTVRGTGYRFEPTQPGKDKKTTGKAAKKSKKADEEDSPPEEKAASKAEPKEKTKTQQPAADKTEKTEKTEEAARAPKPEAGEAKEKAADKAADKAEQPAAEASSGEKSPPEEKAAAEKKPSAKKVDASDKPDEKDEPDVPEAKSNGHNGDESASTDGDKPEKQAAEVKTSAETASEVKENPDDPESSMNGVKGVDAEGEAPAEDAEEDDAAPVAEETAATSAEKDDEKKADREA